MQLQALPCSTPTPPPTAPTAPHLAGAAQRHLLQLHEGLWHHVGRQAGGQHGAQLLRSDWRAAGGAGVVGHQPVSHLAHRSRRHARRAAQGHLNLPSLDAQPAQLDVAAGGAAAELRGSGGGVGRDLPAAGSGSTGWQQGKAPGSHLPTTDGQGGMLLRAAAWRCTAKGACCRREVAQQPPSLPINGRGSTPSTPHHLQRAVGQPADEVPGAVDAPGRLPLRCPAAPQVLRHRQEGLAINGLPAASGEGKGSSALTSAQRAGSSTAAPWQAAAQVHARP